MRIKPSALRNSRRKPDNTEKNLTERITFRLTVAEKNQLSMKAKERGIKLSLLCRLIVMRRRIPDRFEKAASRNEAIVKNEEELAGVIFDLLLDDDGSVKDFGHAA